MRFSDYYYTSLRESGITLGLGDAISPVGHFRLVNNNFLQKLPVPENPKKHSNKKEKGNDLNKIQTDNNVKTKRGDGWAGAHLNTFPVQDGSAPDIGRYPNVDIFA